MIKRLANSFLLATLLIGVLSGTALGFLYRAALVVTENASTAYTMLPVVVSVNNTFLAANGFMSSSGNDTRVQSLGGLNYPHLVADNKTLTALNVGADSQTNLYFVTGESAQVMDIITGYGGYVTTADAVALEPSDNFNIELSGYIDTDNGTSKYLVSKSGALLVFVSPIVAENITVCILGAAAIQQNYDGAASGYTDIYGANWATQTFADAGGFAITYVRIYQSRTGAPGNVTVSIKETSGGEPIGPDLISKTVSANAWGAPAWQTVTFDDTLFLAPGVTYAVVIRAPAGDAGNKIVWRYTNPGGYADGAAGSSANSGATWTMGATDHHFDIYGYPVTSIVSATGVTSGERNIGVWADGVDLGIDIDGTTENSAALGGSVSNTTGNWLWMQNSVMPYASNITLSVGGVRQLYYCPQTMIIGTNLPDREGGDQNGVITWGSNPAGVGVTLGSMTSSGQPSIGSTADTSTSDILPPVGGTDWRPTPGVSAALQANPIRPIVTAISDNTTLSEYQVWVWFGIILVMFVTVLVGANVRGHHLITGVAASAALILLVVWTIFPWWVLPVIVLAIWFGLVSERSPSL